ncbi:MAG: hypothetical protein IJX99_10450 [Clostridia bacterium]|nr:hypothetical protein [Clostridia bacterium]MBQ8300245.1 hypothetical protein [Clostridia bacterium]
MLTNEIHRLIRNLVEATEESQIDHAEVKEALSKAFEYCDGDTAQVKDKMQDFKEQNSDVLQKIREFVRSELTPITWGNSVNDTPILLRNTDFEFVVTALFIYYKLIREQSVVDIEKWMNLVCIETETDRKKAYSVIHTKMKRCLGVYMHVAWQSKRIDKMMARFYQKHMKKW